MQHGPGRRRAAAVLYVLFGTLALGGAIAMASVELLGVAVLSLFDAFVAYHRFPVDRNW